MSKKLNFAYQWIGPKGPITNNRIPTIADLSWGLNIDHRPQRDLLQEPHFHTRFGDDANIVSCHKIPKGKFLYELNFSPYHYRDWRKLFSVNDGPFSDQSITQEDIEYLLANNGYFLVTILFEGWAHDQLFDAMTKFFTHYNIPLDRVIYVTNCHNVSEIYDKYCIKRNVQTKLNVEHFPTFRYDRTNLEEVTKKYVTTEYICGPREKDFLCFQRRYNDQRLAFYIEMHRSNMLDKFYMSMDATQPESGQSFESNITHLANRRPELKITQEETVAAKHSLPLILDTTNFSSYPMEETQFSTEHYYQNSLINIIQETYFYSPEIHLTEKTFKPIAFKQPFIMIGARGSLRHLKDLGFKTFSDFWDESYDSQEDSKRMITIFKLINEISNWSQEQKIQLTKDVKSILDYNCNHFDTMKHEELEHFKEQYGN